MYEKHFQLHRKPFRLHESEADFYVSQSVREILPRLTDCLNSDLGVAVLTGRPGCGKTALLHHLARELQLSGRPVVISGSQIETPLQLLRTIVSHSSGSTDESLSESGRLSVPDDRPSLMALWRKRCEFWGPAILLVDDAHLLPVPVYHEFRSLLDERAGGQTLLRGLVTGPLKLEEALATSAMTDFAQKVRIHAFLEPLTSAESAAYVDQCLSAAGQPARRLMTSEALEAITYASDGYPRNIGLLADESLMAAARAESAEVSEIHVRQALNQLKHLPYSWNMLLEEEATDNSSRVDSSDSDCVIEIAGLDEMSPEETIEVVVSRADDVSDVTAEAASAMVAPAPADSSSDAIEFGLDEPAPAEEAVSEVTAPVMGNVELCPEFCDEEFLSSADQATTDAPDNTAADPLVTGTAEPTAEPADLQTLDHLASVVVKPIEGLDPATDGVMFLSDLQPSDLIHQEIAGGVGASSQHQDPQYCGVPDEATGAQSGSAENNPPLVSETPRMLANARAIFDRYTWLELGRDVPPGLAASSYEAVADIELPETTGTLPTAGPTIPVIDCTDSEIHRSLAEYTSSNESTSGVWWLPNETKVGTSDSETAAEDLGLPQLADFSDESEEHTELASAPPEAVEPVTADTDVASGFPDNLPDDFTVRIPLSVHRPESEFADLLPSPVDEGNVGSPAFAEQHSEPVAQRSPEPEAAINPPSEVNRFGDLDDGQDEIASRSDGWRDGVLVTEAVRRLEGRLEKHVRHQAAVRSTLPADEPNEPQFREGTPISDKEKDLYRLVFTRLQERRGTDRKHG